MCKISVIMTVKNGERDIWECLTSVLHQSFSDFEFLVFDDHSTDTTVNIISNFPDSRIKLFTDSRGYVGNLNRGISLSQGNISLRWIMMILWIMRSFVFSTR